jgi:hypothetical protein
MSVVTFLPKFGGFHPSRWERMISDFDQLYATMRAEAEKRFERKDDALRRERAGNFLNHPIFNGEAS